MKDRRAYGAAAHGPELREVRARLRELHGPALTAGPTPCCTAIARDGKIVGLLGPILAMRDLGA